MSIEPNEQDSFQWTASSIVQSIAIFVLAGFAEIMGGWLVWAAVKGVRVEVVNDGGDTSDNVVANDDIVDDVDDNDDSNDDDDGDMNNTSSKYAITKKPWYFALLGSLTLIAYGFIPCLQPSAASDGFARIYAAYGGFFIVLSFLLGWALEGESAKPDVGDLVGGGVALVGVALIMFWPGR